MLATVPQDIPLREHSHLDLQHSNQAPHSDSMALEDRLCPGCKKSVVNEQGGLVVAFGQSFFHVDCFKCAKCRNQVTADTNLLLLSDGSPICANCSYSCNICHLPILDEAIMTGDDSYHAHCFKCKVCSNRIDELVFAKTSQGIYCMNCHNERMIKIRKHAQKKAERERRTRSTAEESSRSGVAKSHPNQASARTDSSRPPDTFRSPAKPLQGPYPNVPPSSTSSRSPSVTVAPPEPENKESRQPNNLNHYSDHPGQYGGLSKSNTTYSPRLNILGPEATEQLRRWCSPFECPAQARFSLPDNGNLYPHTNNLPPSEGLTVTSRRDKRRSINPGLSLSPFKESSFSAQEQNGSIHSIPSSNHHESERTRSRSSSIRTNPHDPDQDDTIVMTSPPTMTVELENHTDSPLVKSSQVNNKQHRPNSGGPHGQRSSATLSPTDPNGFHSQRRVSSSSNFSLDRYVATSSRSASPAYRADVPHSVESGTDTEPENEPDSPLSDNHATLPPAPPPKDVRNSTRSSTLTVSDNTFDPDTSYISQLGDISDYLGESQAVERMSHTTFIAPALPPIRFSMNTADFSELLSSVGGLPSLKSLDSLAKLTKQSQEGTPSTPPPTAASFETHNEELTPTSGTGGEIKQRQPVDSSSSLAGVPEEPSSVDQQDLVQSPSPPGSGRPDVASEAVPTVVIPTARRADSDPELLILKLREILNNAKEKDAQQLKVDISFVDAIVEYLEARNSEYYQLKNRLDGMNRESKLYIDGMTVAQAEYDRELKARRDAEAEAARLTTLSGDNRRQELRQQMSKELNDNLSGLEHDLSRLKVERDLTLAEVEELSSKRSTGNPMDVGTANLSRSLTKRLENIRNQYQRELVPLNEQKEALNREISELKAVRDVFLEETTVLNARNEELAQLSAVYARRIDNAPETPSKNGNDPSDVPRPIPQTNLVAPSLSSSTSASSTVYDENQDFRLRAPRSDNEMHTPAKGNKFKWPGKAHIEHCFQQTSILRFTRCDHCGDKLWGSQLRCSVCSISIHVRCVANVQVTCTQHQSAPREEPQAPLSPPMFGRDLTEQVHADSRGEERQVPVIVEKCIAAVEARALDYEGVYRKTGGSGQTKAITQMFERGDYASFDLCDADRFNDICSVTSVLKTYFRTLPIPLLTFDLHDQFMAAIAIRDPSLKQRSLVDLVDKLPNEHYFTLRMLMLHLNRVRERCEKNLMNGRNLGVVFGPTLMRSRDPGAEFSDMAGKALFVEWLVDNAPLVFDTTE
ncbi:hypothetical protein BDZ97DRAFT_1780833 [Flammula alnicola]|nr:hypothetical protein BDZ97DRAFT_1780833 [Flammula alnicola]